MDSNLRNIYLITLTDVAVSFFWFWALGCGWVVITGRNLAKLVWNSLSLNSIFTRRLGRRNLFLGRLTGLLSDWLQLNFKCWTVRFQCPWIIGCIVNFHLERWGVGLLVQRLEHIFVSCKCIWSAVIVYWFFNPSNNGGVSKSTLRNWIISLKPKIIFLCCSSSYSSSDKAG